MPQGVCPAVCREPGLVNTQTAAEEARDSPALEWGARIGFVVYGLVYGVLAWLTVQIAVSGGSSAKVSRQGALHEVARQPLGGTMLWIAFGGFCALVLWEAATALVGHHDKDGGKRVVARLASAAKAIVFAVFAFSCAKVASGSGGNKSGGAKTWTARILELPAGPVIVAAAGLAILAYGVYSVIRGLGDGWRKDLDPDGKRGDLGKVITVLARTGYTSRGLAFGIVGGLVIWAAFTQDAQHSGGLDQALQRARHAPLGSALLILIGLGFACYGLYNIARAFYLRRK